MQKGLRVLFLQPQPCIRSLKYAIALKERYGNNCSITFGYLGYPLSKLYGFGRRYFSKSIRLKPTNIRKNLYEIINTYKPQLIHSHNAPDNLTLAAIEASNGIPVIHDVHEVLSLHKSGFSIKDNLKEYMEQEKESCETSNGRIYATGGIKDYIQEQYDLPSKKSIIFLNYASESLMPKHFKRKLSRKDHQTHVVYVGCVTNLVRGSHYDLQAVFESIAQKRIHIHIYPTHNQITKSNQTFKKLAQKTKYFHCHDTLDYKCLLIEMTKYDFGWAGFNSSRNQKHLEIALQNKIFDYISSGLPIIAFPHKTIQRFIEKHNIGLITRDVDELPVILRNTDISRLRKNVIRTRGMLTAENNIAKLMDFYNKIIGD